MINKKIFAMNEGYILACMLSIFMVMSSCKKKPAPEPEQETGSVTDVEGNVYKTIKIGDQWWMAENLRVKKYRDGSGLFAAGDITDSVKWKTDSVGIYCPSLNDQYPDLTGLLYSGYAILNAKKIAPEGWHIPSDEDWKKLEENLGMSTEEVHKTSWRGTHEGEKLMSKEGATKHLSLNWLRYGEVWPTNETGFTAYPADCRMFDGTMGEQKRQSKAFFWSSTPHDSELWYRYLDYKNANIFRYHGPRSYGFSIRCIKN